MHARRQSEPAAAGGACDPAQQARRSEDALQALILRASAQMELVQVVL
jgi:hypothetical protein